MNGQATNKTNYFEKKWSGRGFNRQTICWFLFSIDLRLN